MNVYADAFQTFGFHKSRVDEIVLNTTEKYKDLRFQDYLEQVRKDISNNVEISIAVVGEINLLPSETDAGGINSSSFCRLVLVKTVRTDSWKRSGLFLMNIQSGVVFRRKQRNLYSRKRPIIRPNI